MGKKRKKSKKNVKNLEKALKNALRRIEELEEELGYYDEDDFDEEGENIRNDKLCFLSAKGPKPIGPYSSAVFAGGLIFLSGVIGLVPETGKIVEGGFNEQALQVLKNIGTILEELHMEYDDVVKTTVFVKDISKFTDFNGLYGEYFKEDCPARSVVEVSALPASAEIEVELVATVPLNDLCECENDHE